MPTVVIGVAGGSASGKTTVVDRLMDALGPDRAAAIAHDRYYRDLAALTPEARATVNFDHPDALETDLLVAHLEALRAGAPVDVPVYDFTRHVRRPERERIHPRPIIVIEGILVLADARLRALLDLKVYVHADEAERLERRVARDAVERGRSRASVVNQYHATVRPMHAAIVEPSRQHADIVVPGAGNSTREIQVVVASIQRVLTATPERGRT